jgi:undecaprenyl diphosphate synthase
VEAALDQGLGTLTLYAFSADNWRRPAEEVRVLMSVFDGYLQSEVDRCVTHGIRLSVIGRRDRLPPSLRRRIEVVEAATIGGCALHLRLAIDYSGREAIWLAAERLICTGHRSREEFVSRIGSGRGATDDVPDVDLVIRTGGEQRLSDFLLWEAAYAELVFLSVPWPEFTAADLAGALAEFSRRERRFGGIGPGEAKGSRLLTVEGFATSPVAGLPESLPEGSDDSPGLAASLARALLSSGACCVDPPPSSPPQSLRSGASESSSIQTSPVSTAWRHGR